MSALKKETIESFPTVSMTALEKAKDLQHVYIQLWRKQKQSRIQMLKKTHPKHQLGKNKIMICGRETNVWTVSFCLSFAIIALGCSAVSYFKLS
jgi:hypothetical protein